jgi:hypothetical protein
MAKSALCSRKKAPYRTRTYLIHGNPDSKREDMISHQVVYGFTYSLLTNWLQRAGIRTRFVDLTAPRALYISRPRSTQRSSSLISPTSGLCLKRSTKEQTPHPHHCKQHVCHPLL